MAKKTGKSVSFDAMVKFFLRSYNIPTKQDIGKLTAKIDRLEKLILSSNFTGSRRVSSKNNRYKTSGGKYPISASDTVLEVIKRFRNGVGFGDIQERTGFNDKKLRNIIYRLGKLERITRKSRGVYIAQ